MNSKAIWMTLGIIVVVGLVGYALMHSSAPAPVDGAVGEETMPAGQEPDTASGVDVSAQVGLGDASEPVTVHYNGKTFTPASVTVQKGTKVTFVDDAGSMWLATDQHPSHTGYDGTSRAEHCAPGYAGTKPFDQCGTGSTYSFTFNTTGTWQYHDHVNSSAGGTVVVTE